MSDAHAFLAELESIIDERLRTRPADSYVTRLADSGARRIAQKVGEEGVEVALATVSGERDELVAEAADLVFHLLLALRTRDADLAAVCGVLAARHATRDPG